MIKLNTTSYAILGLLSKKDWPSYEITQHYRNSALFSCWPRAESYLYKEQKKLLSADLIKPANDRNKERRTIYTITPQGEKLLNDWLADTNTCGQFHYEYESLVKFLFSDFNGDPSQIEYVNNITKDAIKDAKEVIEALKKHQNSNPDEHSALNIYVLRFLVDLVELRIHWAKNIHYRLSHAKDLPSSSEKAKKEFEEQINRLNCLIGDQPASN